MAVHVPLSLEAQLEARVLMMSTNNILSPASGKPIIVPSQDIVLGIYYITLERDGEVGEGSLFSEIGEIEHALHARTISMHSKIKVRLEIFEDRPDAGGVNGVKSEEKILPVIKVVETTPGRILLAQILPKHQNLPFSLINRLLTKKDLQNVIDMVYRHCGQKETVIFADRLMGLGFYHACRAGISFGKDDLVIPQAKIKLVATTTKEVKEYEQQYQDGLITSGEKYNKVVDAWSRCSDRVAEEMMKGISTPLPGKPVNAVWMMAHSGARGSATQMKQLAGMRGLMTKPSGEIIETPILSNFKEGLSVLEYFNSTHGARKGLADTALKTANSGYLTRRLVDVAQDCIIIEEDCGTNRGLTMRAVVDGGDVIEPLSERVLGRSALDDVVDPLNGNIIIKSGDLIDEVGVELIDKAGIEELRIRSVLTCDTKIGVCGKCYGRDLARGTKVNIGEAVGVIAAQSIGEPGTQLTMRTFHIGGAAQRGAEQSNIEASHDGTIQVRNRNIVMNSAGVPVVMGRNTELVLIDGAQRERAKHRVPYGARLLIDNDTPVTKGQKLAEWDPYTLPIITEKAGKAVYVDLVEGTSMREVIDDSTGISNRVVVDWKGQPKGGDLRPRIVIHDASGNPIMLGNGQEARYLLSLDSVLSVENGQEVHAGDILARIPREGGKNRDITGGLPRVAELFEARKPKDFAIICDISGRIEFGKDYKNKRRVLIVPEGENAEPVEYLIPKTKRIAVQEGDFVERGDLLIDGNPVPHDILRVLGIEKLAEYLVNEIQEVYRLQGVKINDKHIETIARQMLQKVEITDAGDSTFLLGEQIDKGEYELENAKLLSEKLKPAKADPVLLGITKASLQTKSFISAASFQETTRVLTEAAVSGRVDTLQGLKENVIVGRLIPAGTGGVVNRLKAIAGQRDRAILAAGADGEDQPVPTLEEERAAD